MPRFKIEMERTQWYEVEIEAESEEAALRYAQALSPGISPQHSDAHLVNVLEDDDSGWEIQVWDEHDCYVGG